MKEIFSAVARELKKDASTDEVTALIRKHISRRQFLAGSGALGLGVAAFSILGCGSSGASGASEAPRQVFVANALGMVVSEPSRCVGCRRCELACTEFNDGIAQPSIARIKVGRNYNLGPLEAGQGFKGAEYGATSGSFRIPAVNARIRCPVSWRVRMAPSRSSPRSMPGWSMSPNARAAASARRLAPGQ